MSYRAFQYAAFCRNLSVSCRELCGGEGYVPYTGGASDLSGDGSGYCGRRACSGDRKHACDPGDEQETFAVQREREIPSLREMGGNSEGIPCAVWSRASVP